MATKEKIQEAIENWGSDVVSTVREIVHLADADGAYVQFEDMGMFEHAECVEFLYFDQE
jgi:hypothetical protein